MDKKIVSLAVAIIMILTVTPVLIDNDTDATGINDTTVNVFFYTGSTWNTGSYEVFNLYEAVQAGASNNALGYGFTTASGATSWTTTSTTDGTYPNMSYGLIESVKKTSSDLTTSFKIMACNSGDAGWTDITSYPLGWIRPFTDYDAYATWATSYTNAPGVAYANVAIYLTDDTPTMPTTGLKGLTDPTTRTDCLYDFTIYDVAGAVSFADNTYYGKQYNSSGTLELTALS